MTYVKVVKGNIHYFINEQTFDKFNEEWLVSDENVLLSFCDYAINDKQRTIGKQKYDLIDLVRSKTGRVIHG